MDLSPTRFRPAACVLDWSAMIAVAVARQSASPTARFQARLDASEPRPGGAFARSVAASMAGWQE